MKRLLLIIILSSSVILSQNYKKIKVFISEKTDINTLASSGIPLEEAFFDKKDKSLTLFVSDDELNTISGLSFRTEILISDWHEYFNNRLQLEKSELEAQKLINKSLYNVSGFGYGSHAGFYTVEEVYRKLDSMKLLYPSLITQKTQIGTTFQGRPIYVVKISDSPDKNEDEPEVFYNAMIHAREPQGMMVLMYFMYYLLENYNVDPQVTYLINNRELYFVPIINVDGYEYNRKNSPQGGGMYRKNMNGVDLNRNFGYEWGYDNFGSSPDVNSETYRGVSAFSEAETQVIRDFCNQHQFRSALNYHTYSNLLISPWGYVNKESPDSLIFRDFSADMTEYNNYAWGTSGDLLYNTNGDADDWMYGEQAAKNKIFSMTPEVGGGNDGFWPPMNRIFPLAQENLYPNLYLAWTAGAYVKLTDFRLDREYINPGETIEITPVLRNKGLENMQNFTVELVPLTNNASVLNALTLSELTSRSTLVSEVPFYVHIFSNASVQDDIKLLLKVKVGYLQMSADTIHLRLGSPKTIFKDTTDAITDLWNTSSQWALTNSDYHSAPNSYTDSKSGHYPNNTTASLTLKNSIDLAGYNNPVLTFYHKYDIENEWDYAQVLVSSDNGFNWKALNGNHTKYGNASKPAEPLFDGKQEGWVKEEMDAKSYSGAKIKIKFELVSDYWEQRDGWYIDDIAVVYYAILPVELTAFSLTPEKNAVKISWTTATELNNSGFFIQRSPDNTNWANIEFMKGNGTSVSENRYIYYDKAPLNGRSFYRLVQVDYDGTKNILEVSEIDGTNIFEYALYQNYPNPFNSETIIRYSIPVGQFVKITLYDMTGREAAVLVNKYQDAGRYEAVLNTDGLELSSGTYIYSLKLNNFTSQMKLVLIK